MKEQLQELNKFLESTDTPTMHTIRNAVGLIFEATDPSPMPEEASTETEKQDVVFVTDDMISGKILDQVNSFEYKKTGKVVGGEEVYDGKWGKKPYQFRKKPEAKIDQLFPEFNEVIYKAYKVFFNYSGYIVTITSGNDYNKHANNSFHYKNAAIDIRMKDIPAKTGEKLFKMLSSALQPNFVAMLEYGFAKRDERTNKVTMKGNVVAGEQHPEPEQVGKIEPLSAMTGNKDNVLPIVQTGVHIHIQPTSSFYAEMEKNKKAKGEVIAKAEEITSTK